MCLRLATVRAGGLQPYVPKAAALCAVGCNRTCRRLPPYVRPHSMCQAGDLDGIRASTQIDWNFVYPPAYVDPDSGEKQLEAWCGHACACTRVCAKWAMRGLVRPCMCVEGGERPGGCRTQHAHLVCTAQMHARREARHARHARTHAQHTHTPRCRTPLCLLVRPDEGNFESKLRGISESDRQALPQQNYDYSLCYIWLQPLLNMVAASTTHGLSLYCTWLQPLLHMETPSTAHGCRRCCRTCSLRDAPTLTSL